MSYGVIHPSIIDAIGNTPLVGLQRLGPQKGARIVIKCEFLNPLSSVKDRIGKAMIDAAEQDGLLTPETQIIEPTSGNTGIALGFAAAAKGYRLTLVIPESMSQERRALLRALGANFILTPAAEGMPGAMRHAQELLHATPNNWMPRQFENPANPKIHSLTTGPEIWFDTKGRVDILVAGVGTGGTITGVARYLRQKGCLVRVVAVEPSESPVISGKKPGSHGIQGIGVGFVPKNLDLKVVDAVETVSTDDAYLWARRLAEEEGLLGGISTGANVAVAARLASRRENYGKTIVTFACSSGERYLSTRLYELVGLPPLAPALVG